MPCLAVAPCLSVQEGSSATILPHPSLVGQAQRAVREFFVSSLCLVQNQPWRGKHLGGLPVPCCWQHGGCALGAPCLGMCPFPAASSRAPFPTPSPSLCPSAPRGFFPTESTTTHRAGKAKLASCEFWTFPAAIPPFSVHFQPLPWQRRLPARPADQWDGGAGGRRPIRGRREGGRRAPP